jgi:hypothetical protein
MPLLRSNKGTLCIVATDPDNLPIALIAEYAMKQAPGKFLNPGAAVSFLKTRRSTANPLEQFLEGFGSENKSKVMTKKTKPPKFEEMSTEDKYLDCFRRVPQKDRLQMKDMLEKIV